MTLSIVIPTYNREQFLRPLVEDLCDVMTESAADIELIVIDNASTDNTRLFLEEIAAKKKFKFSYVIRDYNVGMEGNIVAAVMAGVKKYTWLLSDHQTINKKNVLEAFGKLNHPDFDCDFACAKISQWESILPIDQTVEWHAMSAEQKGKMAFTLGNMSCLMFKTTLKNACTREVYRGCKSGYPHLGLLFALHEHSKFREFSDLTALPVNVGAKINHAYDVIIARYRENLLLVKSAVEYSGVSFGKKHFFTRNYRKSFLGDVLSLLTLKKENANLYIWRLLKIIPCNPLSLSMVASLVLISLLIVPEKIRLSIAKIAKQRFKNRILR